MNTQKFRELLALYKAHFRDIHRQEIYKWQAVKRFQEHWNIEAIDFFPMLQDSLQITRNLLASGNYFARRMLLLNAEMYPEEVRRLFIELYDEEIDLVSRIESFQTKFEIINRRTYPDSIPYQDDRAVVVYLSLRYPNSYYLYKFTMFKDFVNLVEYPYEPIKGRIENVTQYQTMCNLLKEEIVRDSELLELHKTRIGPNEFFDSSYNILTQDVIYASTLYLQNMPVVPELPPASARLIKINRSLTPASDGFSLVGSFTNYIDLERNRKRIGDLGELLVFEWEKERLGHFEFQREPVHVAASKGDGLGYDILSYDERGEEKYIEVKTTTSGENQPFYITRNELQRSIQNSDNFVLYRLYNFDVTNMTAQFFEWKGDLSALCINPIQFRAVF